MFKLSGKQPEMWLRQSKASSKKALGSRTLYGYDSPLKLETTVPGDKCSSDFPEYDQLQPEELDALRGSPFAFFFRVMLILGVVTVRLKSPRIPMFHPYKSTFIVLLPLYIGLLYCVYLLICEYLAIVSNQSITSDTRLISSVKVLFLTPLCFMPVAWVEMPSYFQKQVEAAKYEKLFQELTGEKITWKRVNLYVKLFTLYSFTSTLAVLYCMSLMPEFDMTLQSGLLLMIGFQVQLQIAHGNLVRSVMLWCMAERLRVFFEKLLTLRFNFVVNFILQTRVIWLFTMMYVLASTTDMTSDYETVNNPARSRKDAPMSTSDLRLVRKLWVSLRDIFDTEDRVFFIFVLIFVYLFMMLTLVLYIALSFIATGKSLQALAASAAALAFIVELYSSSATSHLATATMHYPFIRMLDGHSVQSTDFVFIEEINFFYSTVNAQLPRLSLGGYANIDKPLASSVTSVVVTYLIVLVQFRLNFIANTKDV